MPSLFGKKKRSGSATSGKENDYPPTFFDERPTSTGPFPPALPRFGSSDNSTVYIHDNKIQFKPAKSVSNVGEHRNFGFFFGNRRQTESEDMMDFKKPYQTPTNPPPPIPHHKRHLNSSPDENIPQMNGATNGFVKNVVQSMPAKKVSPKGSASSNASAPVMDRDVPVLKLNGHVGFDTLPYQLVHKSQKEGFQFNLLCVGETGMGKTTLIESLFNMKLGFDPCNNELKTVELRTKVLDVVESGVSVKLRIVETAGFGDQLDKDMSSSAKVIADYINHQFEEYLKEELKIHRSLARYDDTRIHACLYFVSPTGHGLKALDLATIRGLAKQVNVIPVIAKADTTCKDELAQFKKKILAELKSNDIEIYQFPTDDETVRRENTLLNSLMPFAVVGSTDFVEREDGKKVRARRYPWGIVEVENEEHCDFVKLREALLRINVDSLRVRTHAVLYETYRRDRLKEMKIKDGDCGPKMMEAYEEKRREFMEDMKRKEDQFQKSFVEKVNEKEEELKRRDELLTMREREMKDRFAEENVRLESSINTLMEEKARLEGRLTIHNKKKEKVR